MSSLAQIWCCRYRVESGAAGRKSSFLQKGRSLSLADWRVIGPGHCKIELKWMLGDGAAPVSNVRSSLVLVLGQGDICP
ncbi:hypothetical protein ABKV19_017715 [Rosa sericea]